MAAFDIIKAEFGSQVGVFLSTMVDSTITCADSSVGLEVACFLSRQTWSSNVLIRHGGEFVDFMLLVDDQFDLVS